MTQSRTKGADVGQHGAPPPPPPPARPSRTPHPPLFPSCCFPAPPPPPPPGRASRHLPASLFRSWLLPHAPLHCTRPPPSYQPAATPRPHHQAHPPNARGWFNVATKACLDAQVQRMHDANHPVPV